MTIFLQHNHKFISPRRLRQNKDKLNVLFILSWERLELLFYLFSLLRKEDFEIFFCFYTRCCSVPSQRISQVILQICRVWSLIRTDWENISYFHFYCLSYSFLCYSNFVPSRCYSLDVKVDSSLLWRRSVSFFVVLSHQFTLY